MTKYLTWDAPEMPPHKVVITDPFWCSVYPWTQILHEGMHATVKIQVRQSGQPIL